jgi:DNA polymerase III subunit gamma/tau
VLGLVNQTTIGKLVDHMAGGNAGEGLALLNALVAEGVELGQLADQVIAYLRSLTVTRVAGSTDLLDLPPDARARIGKQAQKVGAAALLAMLKEWTEARGALRDQVPGVPQLPLEMALLRSSIASNPEPPVASAVRATPPERPVARAEATPAAVRLAPPVTSEVPAQRPQPEPPALQTEPSRQEDAPRNEPAPAPPAADAGDELHVRVTANWDRFMAVAKTQCGFKITAALKNVKEVETEGRVLVLRFPAAHNFSREMVEEPTHKAQVEAAWRQVLGEEVGVRCSLLGSAPAAQAGGEKQVASRAGGDALLEDAKRRGAVVRQLD